MSILHATLMRKKKQPFRAMLSRLETLILLFFLIPPIFILSSYILIIPHIFSVSSFILPNSSY